METYFCEFTPAQSKLLFVAEQLFAERGIHAVGDREIARAAGQKNNSAVKYHFESREALEQALLDYRLLPFNALLGQMLSELSSEAPLDQLLQVWFGAALKQLKQFAGKSRIFNLLLQYQLMGQQKFLEENPIRFAASNDCIQRLTLLGVDAASLQTLVGASLAEWENELAREPALTFSDIAKKAEALQKALLEGFIS